MKLRTYIRYRLFQGLKIAALLLFLVSCGPGSGRYAQLLEEAEWMNRNDSLFTTDSVMLRVVRHYDHWWYNRNTRMKAYYLLGSAYRDLGEAPAAIHYYNMAVERADTLSPDCDYATLFRVYGQMAMVYGFQNMPWEKREAIEHYKHFALLAGDTLSSIIAYEQMTDVCYQLDDTLGVYAYTDSASMLYRKYGYEQRAKGVYFSAIFVCVTSGDYDRAAYYMDLFEHEAGIFDNQGRIESGREIYYYCKGLYYMGTEHVDSAEVYFRRLIPYGHTYEAYKGLLSVYEARNNTDSIIKYVHLFEDAMTRWMGNRQYNEILQSSALYKYERNQHLAEQKARQAQATLYLVLFLLLLLVLIVLLSYQGYRHYKAKIQKKEQVYRQLIAEYERTQQEYQQKCYDLELLQQNLNILRQITTAEASAVAEATEKELRRRDEELEEYRIRITEYEAQIGLPKALEKEEFLNRFHIVRKCRAFVEHKETEGITTKDLNKVLQIYEGHYPRVYARLEEARLSHQEILVCVLLLLKFDTYQIVQLLGKSSQSITNSKTKANRKLFHQESADSLYRNLKRLFWCNLV